MGGLATSLGLAPTNQRRVCVFLALPRHARIVISQSRRLAFHATARLQGGVLPAPRARPLVGFVLDGVRSGDLATRFAEVLGAVAERKVAERAQQERGRVVVVGGGKVALLAEGVEVFEDKLSSLSILPERIGGAREPEV